MTHIDTTAAALLAGILARPDDDTPRLVYADWLDEHAGTVPCEVCKGDGLHRHQFPPMMKLAPVQCDRCHGTGTVSDKNAERAEFIRVQCAIAAADAEPPTLQYLATQVENEWFKKMSRLERGQPFDLLRSKSYPVAKKRLKAWHEQNGQRKCRERELLAAHRRAWARVPCPVCGDKVSQWCDVCDGTGDAMLRRAASSGPNDEVILSGQPTPYWHRGFVYRIDVPGLEWVCERCDGCTDGVIAPNPECSDCRGAGWRVTPWSLAIARTHPVTDFGIGDREPAGSGIVWTWERTNYPDLSPELPPILWDELTGETLDNTFDGIKVYDSREAAILALAQAAGVWVRDAVREMWAKEGRP